MSITLSDARIRLDAEPSVPARPALEVAMPGHCPGRANWRWLLEQKPMTAQIELAGYTDPIERLRELRDGAELSPDLDIAALTRLYDLPIPISSFSQFEALFPQAFSTGAEYRSHLAGNAAWLPLAVRDFFAGTQGSGPQRLWVIPVRQRERQQGFLPNDRTDWNNGILQGALDRALGLPDVGLIALPDLERLQIPADLPDIPRLRLPNLAPAFLPCGSSYDDTHRERRHSKEVPRPPAPLEFVPLLHKLSGRIAKYRPDMHLLLGMPFDPQSEGETPQIKREDLRTLARAREAGNAAALRRVQLLFPYLRSARHAMMSACGAVAAEMARRTAQGAWLSAAGRPLGNRARPYPPLNRHYATSLREQHAIGVMIEERGQLKLDDECLAAGVFDDHSAHARSGEIARFLGWLQRELRRLGEALVFDTDPRDTRPRILLESFFGRLHARGALRGRLPGDAFRIEQHAVAESTLVFEIDIAPAFPIDRIRVSITRDGHDAAWRVQDISGIDT